MPEEKKISELGLAEFVSTLIGETFDAILTAQEEQSSRIAQIIEIADKSPAEIAQGFITSEETEVGLQNLFPSSNEPFCLIYPGAIYRTEPNEFPAIYALSGYKMTKQDSAGGKITETGYQAVKQQVLLVLASEKLRQIREMIRHGLPRIQVDNGKILAKVSFSVRETETEGTEPTTVNNTGLSSTFMKKIDMLSGKALRRIQLPAARMMVKQATESGTSAANNTSIYGEVEIHFRSVQ